MKASVSADQSYVYLLVDERADQPHGGIFYVGKGTGTRALDHFVEAQALLSQGDTDAAEALLAQVDDDLPEGAPDQYREEKATKAARMREIFAAGGNVRIDILRQGISSALAYQIESAVIDALGMDEHLANRVRGHNSFRYSARVVRQIENASTVPLVDEAVVVGVKGLWGGASALNGLIGVDETVIWENARQRWSVGEYWRRVILDRAEEGTPVLLIAVALRDRFWKSQVLGVWEITGLKPIPDESAWEFLSSGEPTDRLIAARNRYVGNTMSEDGERFDAQSGVRYSQVLWTNAGR